MTSPEFAAFLNVERSTVWRWYVGDREVPRYAMIVLSALTGFDAHALRQGRLQEFKVERRHVYDHGDTYKDLAFKWHPDRSGRDTNGEMHLINEFRKSK